MTDDRRQQQIAAVRDVMGWEINPESEYEPATAELAAELVDAVEAVPRTPADQVGAHARRCTCGHNLAGRCGARGFACMGETPGQHQGGCTLPAGHDGGHSWQRRQEADRG